MEDKTTTQTPEKKNKWLYYIGFATVVAMIIGTAINGVRYFLH